MHGTANVVALNFVLPDGTKLPSYSERILGIGKTGVVLRHGAHALKIARVEDTSGYAKDQKYLYDELNFMNIESLQEEMDIYRLLGTHRGILHVFQMTCDSIEMEYASSGTLEDCITRYREPTDALKAKWIQSVVETLSHVHTSRVAVHDVALRNFLVDDQLAVRLIDFGLSIQLDKESETQVLGEELDHHQTDLFRIGFILYSIATWKCYDNDLFEDEREVIEKAKDKSDESVGDQRSESPRPPNLPSTDNCIGSKAITRCWSKGYSHAEQLCNDIQNEIKALEMPQENNYNFKEEALRPR